MSTTGPQVAQVGVRKAISPGRDRLQSRLLVWIGVPILFWSAIESLRQVLAYSGGFIESVGRYDTHVQMSIAASLLFALVAWRLRAATAGASACGALICFLLTQSTHWIGSSIAASALSPLLLLFILTYLATKQSAVKTEAARNPDSPTSRNAAQVIANLGVAGFVSSFYGLFYVVWPFMHTGDWLCEISTAWASLRFIPLLAALAEATADTVSSEIGQAYGGPPLLITTMRRVPAGTDGAITLRGTGAGIAAAGIVVASAIPALGMNLRECGLALVSGIAGFLFDSLLGATLERKGWLGNDLVNFLSTGVAVAVALVGLNRPGGWLLR